jgi:hypothetical protein
MCGKAARNQIGQIISREPPVGAIDDRRTLTEDFVGYRGTVHTDSGHPSLLFVDLWETQVAARAVLFRNDFMKNITDS